MQLSKPKLHSFSIYNLLFLVVFGLIFSGVGGGILYSMRVDPSWTKVNGTVTSIRTSTDSDGGTTYAPNVSYKVNGQEYQVSSSFSTGFRPNIGSVKSVAYNPENPNDAKIAESLSTTWWLFIFPFFGIGAIVIGVIAYVRARRRASSVQNLKSSGLKLQGVVSSVSDAGRNGVRFTVSATDTNGVVQEYQSDLMSGISGISLIDYQKNPIAIDVYINPLDQSEYYVDIDDVPALSSDKIVSLLKNAQNNTIN